MAEAAAPQPTTTPEPARAGKGDREALAGLVERVTVHNPETGLCVLRVRRPSGHRRPARPDAGLAVALFCRYPMADTRRTRR